MPYFAEEISPFLKVFSGWYLSKKILNHLFLECTPVELCMPMVRGGYLVY
jgi:hypothetical protein